MNKLFMVFTTLTPTNTLLLAVMAIFAPLQPVVFAVLFLIVMDAITGIIASYYREKVPFKFWKWSSWKHITSKRLGDTLTKSTVYMILIISGFVIDVFIIQNAELWFTKIMSGAIALREIKSLVENGENILGGGFINMVQSFVRGGFRAGMDDMFREKGKSYDKPMDESIYQEGNPDTMSRPKYKNPDMDEEDFKEN